MLNSRRVTNPFVLLMNPESVLQVIERSERLDRLERRICRPLDQPVLGQQGPAERADADRLIEMTEEPSESDPVERDS